MTLPDKFESIWMGTTPATHFPKLEKEVDADIVIVGGGIAGLNAAYFLKQKGQKVVVLEANKIATGTSGNTTAKVTSLHELRYAYLDSTFGKESAQLYADSNQWAIGELENIIKQKDIDCNFIKAPSFTYTKVEKDVEKIKQEAEIALELNLPASFVTSIEAVPFEIKGAVRFDDQAYFHPRKYLLALANLINSDGSYIFESTRVLDIEEKNGYCEVKTGSNGLRVKFVVISTNFPFYDPNGLFAKLDRVGSYAIALNLNAEYPEGMGIGTKEQDLSFRPHKDQGKEWLIIGGKHRNIKEIGDINENFDELARLASNDFPVSGIEYKWGAQDTMSLDLIPYIGKLPLSEKIFVTTGFSTWGMTTSLISAKLLTDLILGESNPWKDLYGPARLKIIPQCHRERV